MLVRSIPDTDHADAMGPYPLFVCSDWEQIGKDLEAHQDDWVSAAVVTDPLGASEEVLSRQEFDVVRPFKPHYLIDLSIPYRDAVSSRHREYARYARRNGVQTVRIEEPKSKLDTWIDLYDHLIDRHDITGIQAFSPASFERQFEVPGLVMFFATYDGKPAAAHLWFEMGDVAYSHLVAHSAAGYESRSSYAIHQAAIKYFESRVQWLNLGGGVGTSSEEKDGLSQFKSGWATTSRSSFLCGRVLQPSVYDKLTATETNYFPAYRAGELV